MFSILIAQYNNGRFFEDCYKSIIAQTYSHWEAIIVDDGSTDNSVEIMQKLIGGDTRFKLYINPENKGCGYTKKKCAEFPKGEICGFVDPDDTITETAIEEMVKKHLEFPDVSLIYSNFIFCDENLVPQKVHYQKQAENGKKDFFNIEREINHFVTFKNHFYNKTEGIDAYLQRAVDQDLYMKLYEVGKVFYLNRDFYLYRIHKGGISKYKNARKAYFWYWVGIISAARRRNINVEDLFLSEFIDRDRGIALEKEIVAYNQSLIFKILRKLKFFKI